MSDVTLEHSRLRTWRLFHSLTLRNLSDLTGTSMAMISRVERGERQMSPLAKASFARCLGVPIAALFDVEES